VLWCQVKKVYVNVALNSYGCVWMFCEDFFYGYIEILCKVRVVVWSSVDINDGVDGVCLSRGFVDLENDCCCLGDGDI
jgi:hypothetical protein